MSFSFFFIFFFFCLVSSSSSSSFADGAGASTGDLPGVEELTTWEDAIYFSIVTFTTLGYGDITISGGWRLLSGIEAMSGILLFGWSAALLFALVQQLSRMELGVERE